jgi:hypothetical protein
LGWKRFAHRKENVSDAWLFLGIWIAQILFYAKFWSWAADDSWGPRYVLVGTILLCIPMVAVLNRRAIVIPVVVAGILVQLLAVTVGSLDYVLLLRSSHPQRDAVLVGGRNRIDFADLWFNPNYSEIAGNWILLRYLLHIPPAPEKSEEAGKIDTPLSNAIPPEDWKAAARWDFIWNVPRSAAPRDAPKPAPPIAYQPVQ